MKLNVQQVRSAPPKARPYTLADGSGLTLHVATSGRKTWRFRFRYCERHEEVALGSPPKVSLSQARERVAEMRERLARNQNPAEDVRRVRRSSDPWITVEQFAVRWQKDVVAHARKDPKVIARVLKRDVFPALGRRPVALVAPAEIQKLVYGRRDGGAPAAAALILRTLQRLFEYAQACGIVTANPTDPTPVKFVVQHKSRSRTLSHGELRVFLQRLVSPAVPLRLRLTLKVILLTLCRKGELRRAEWEHIDLRRMIWEVPAELSKTGLPHIVYLSRQAVECFEKLRALAGRAEVVLPAQSALTVPVAESTLNSQMQRVKWGIPHFTPHDLRRTGSTLLHEMGYNPDWIEKALNHSAKGIRGVYNRAQYGEQRKQMLQEWADWLEGL